MAKEIQNTTQIITRSFTKGLNKDADASFVSDGMWTHARNATNNSDEGNLGTLSNESANYLCATAGNTMPLNISNKYIIGAIQLYSDKWVIFTSGQTVTGKTGSSEIGLLETDTCTYRPIVQDSCLNFDKRFLITGSAREKEDCTWQVYWADGTNPDRVLNIGDPKTWPDSTYQWLGQANINYYSNGTQQLLWPGVAWQEICNDGAGCVQTSPGVWPANCPHDYSCITCKPINSLDCDKIRLARFMTTPCLKLTLGNQGGTLRNGTYFATIAYSIKGQQVTDYFSPSNTQPIWFPNDLQGSLTLEVEADYTNFDEFILVMVQNINQGTVAKQIGIYSTRTNKIVLDQIKEDLISVPLSRLPLQNPVFEKSDQMAEVNNYLLRVGPTSKLDFNYQPLANQIKTRWVSAEYPADYYVKGGHKASYLRDEVYSFFIRFVYDTGDKSASYHIPGRPARLYSPGVYENAPDTSGNALNAGADPDRIFEVHNTATVDPTVGNPLINTTTDDGGVIIGTGEMGYWESEEVYPDNRADIWNASGQCFSRITGNLPYDNTVVNDYDLCGKPIRHHKFPDNLTDPGSALAPSVTNHFKPIGPYLPDPLKIRLMGVQFDNIIYPKDNDGNDIPGIVAYEILRGSREGNRSIIAKGMLNNFRTYEVQGQVQNSNPQSRTTGLYANYPFNTINGFYNTGSGNDHNRPFMDPYIRIPDLSSGTQYTDDVLDQRVPLDMVSFHSPDTMFNTPFLSTTELKLYGYLRGVSNQQYIEPNKHPQFKLLSDLALVPAFLAGVLEAILSLRGKFTINSPNYTAPGYATDATGVALTAALGAASAANVIYNTPVFGYNALIQNYFNGGAGFLADTLTTIVGAGTPILDAENAALDAGLAPLIALGGVGISGVTYNYTMPDFAYLGPLGIAQAATQFLYYFAEGADTAITLIKALLPYRQFALQMLAHGFYGDMRKNNAANGLYRFKIQDSFYIRDNIQQVPSYQDISGNYNNYSINNLKRSDTVVIRTTGGPNVPSTSYVNGVLGPNYIVEPTGVGYVDQSLTTLGHIVQNGIVNANNLSTLTVSGLRAPDFENIDIPWQAPIASHYAGLKVRLRNQYGQLRSVKQIVITPCEQKFDYYDLTNTAGTINCGACNTDKTKRVIKPSGIFFGGDVFINRYTEKNSMFYFYDWLFGQPDGFEYNYQLHQMIPRPRFFVNSKNYDISELSPSNWSNPTPGTGILPTNFYRLDYYAATGLNPNRYYNYTTDQLGGFPDTYPGIFGVKNANFYLGCSSVRDFFVESDVLVDFRIAGDYEWEKHYDPYRYTPLVRMFDIDPQNITRGNWYRYDYSLSISKLYNQYFSSGNLQSRYYDPKVAKLCYTYYPDRIYYSLQQQDESFKDSWYIFLPNNYREFKSQLSGVKAINKSGLFITFKNDSPQMFQGVDTLETDLNTKITIGDGGLFSQPGQSASNADRPYEYASSQNKWAVISTPAGLFFTSQNQGKIFKYAGGLTEISQVGMKWWFSWFLKYKLTKYFPDYSWQDNPVAGIGIQAVYDNENSILYFCKKDYDILPEIDPSRVDYIPYVTDCRQETKGVILKKGEGDYFTLDGKGRYLLGDPRIFISASWTISYDPKSEFWVSFHDWHPDFVIPGKGVFHTTKANTIWKHNYTCQQYCNYYGVNYPFEIEFPIITGQSTTIVKSIEYILECYRRDIDCVDQFHVLDFNFDTAIVYNSEQISGYLKLNLFPKNNIPLTLQYPKYNASAPVIIDSALVGRPGFDILFSKEENKYRFNQFWDVTKNRAEFPDGAGYPPQGTLVPNTTILQGNYPEQYQWITRPDGYRRDIITTSLDFNKPELQRKKFRHYVNFLTLRREISGNTNMIVKLVNSKNQLSPR